MTLLLLLACRVDSDADPTVPLEELRMPDGRSMEDWLRQEMTLNVDVDWRAGNAADFPPDRIWTTIDSFGETAVKAWRPDDSNPQEYWTTVTGSVSSETGQWACSMTDEIFWFSNEGVRYGYDGAVLLDPDEAARVDAALIAADVAPAEGRLTFWLESGVDETDLGGHAAVALLPFASVLTPAGDYAAMDFNLDEATDD